MNQVQLAPVFFAVLVNFSADSKRASVAENLGKIAKLANAKLFDLQARPPELRLSTLMILGFRQS